MGVIIVLSGSDGPMLSYLKSLRHAKVKPDTLTTEPFSRGMLKASPCLCLVLSGCLRVARDDKADDGYEEVT